MSIETPLYDVSTLPMVGGDLALDFANTVSDLGDGESWNYLSDASDVISWLIRARALTASDADAARAWLTAARSNPEALLRETGSLRNAIRGVADSLSAGQRPGSAELQKLTQFHGHCLSAGQLTPAGATFAWTWPMANRPLEALLGPVALSAIALITTAEVRRIKRCGGDHCGWLFFDTSKNRSRRWCDMNVCGNRAKQRAMRARINTFRADDGAPRR